MSISTACVIVRSARESSRIEVSLAIAVGVAAEVFNSGRLERSASSRSSAGGAKPPVITTHGTFGGEGEPQRRRTGRRFEALQVPHFAFAENQDPAGFEEFVKAGEGEPGLLNVRAGDDAGQAIRAGQQIERQAERLGPAAKQHADAQAGTGGISKGSRVRVQEVAVRVTSPQTKLDFHERQLPVGRRDSTLIEAVSRSRKTTMPSRLPSTGAASAIDIVLTA